MSQVLTQQYPERLDVNTIGPNLHSAAALMEWIYRIKTWRHTIAFVLDGAPWPYNGVYDVPARGVMTDGIITTFGPSNERELVRPSFPTNYCGRIEFSPFAGQASISHCQYFDVVTVDGVQAAWKADFIAIFVDPISLENRPQFPEEFRPASATMGIDYPNPVTGINIPLYEGIPIVPAPNRWGGTYTITPIEWWPCAPTSGGLPVFNSATGAQINPNIVID